MAPRELIFTGEGDLDGFLFNYELVQMRGMSDEELTLAFPAYLAGESFEFYREGFSKENRVTEEGTYLTLVKNRMCAKY